jgi:NAD(P)-dependent dehydrogenase (short-subunit alcohol dehydrogenase family)
VLAVSWSDTRGMTQTSTPDLIHTPFGFDSTAAEVIAGIDLSGQRAIVTGASSGIGVETARALVGAGAEVTLAVRDTEAGQRTATDLSATSGGAVHVRRLDLADPSSIAAFAGSWTGPLHLLINNAGVMALPGAHPDPGRLGAPVRNQPPRPLRARGRAARRAHRRW